jgi:DNA-binding beta-propeller fold protein YncE
VTLAVTVCCAATSSSAWGADRIYWANSNGAGISFADLGTGAGTDLPIPASHVDSPEGVALDLAGGKLYWPNYGNDTISYANIDGSNPAELNTTGADVNEPWGIAIDPTARRVYWVNDGGSTVSYANLDGTGGGNVNITGATPPVNGAGVALDLAARRIYWAAAASDKISYASLDGGGGGDVNITGVTLDSPDGIAVDPASRKLFWASENQNKIYVANLDGSSAAEIITTGATVNAPEGVAVDPDAGRIYWGNYASPSKVSFARLDGTGGEDLPITDATLSGAVFPSVLKSPSPAGPPAVTRSGPNAPLVCSTGSWAPDLPGSFVFRSPSAFTFAWQLGGTELAEGLTLSVGQPGAYTCRTTASNPAGSVSQTSAPLQVVTIAKLGGLSITRRVFAPARSSTPLTGQTARRHKRGTRFSFTLDQAATVRVTIQRRTRGRRVGHACRPNRPSLHRKRRCTRYVRVARLTRTGHAGSNQLPFTGRIRRKPLRPGTYRAVFVAVTSAGSSKSTATSFRVVKR